MFDLLLDVVAKLEWVSHFVEWLEGSAAGQACLDNHSAVGDRHLRRIPPHHS
jgi:hypothetical protein